MTAKNNETEDFAHVPEYNPSLKIICDPETEKFLNSWGVRVTLTGFIAEEPGGNPPMVQDYTEAKPNISKIKFNKIDNNTVMIDAFYKDGSFFQDKLFRDPKFANIISIERQ